VTEGDKRRGISQGDEEEKGTTISFKWRKRMGEAWGYWWEKCARKGLKTGKKWGGPRDLPWPHRGYSFRDRRRKSFNQERWLRGDGDAEHSVKEG